MLNDLIGKRIDVSMYEDIIDKQIITEYETKENNGKIKFVDSNDIINMLQNQKNGT